MFYYNQYVRAQSLDEAYELYQKKPNFVLGGMLWLKMKNKTLGTAIDLCDLGLDQIDEDENEFRIGAACLLILIVYVLVSPLCDLQFTLIVLFPTASE